MEELLRRLEIVVLRFESIGAPTPLSDEEAKAKKEAQEAADRYVTARKRELQGIEPFD